MTSKELIESYAAGNRDFRHAYLSGAILSDAILSGANLFDADLRGADLCRATLRDATLRGADLIGANLSGANLSNADLSGAKDFPTREIAKRQIVPASGDLHVWKKLAGGAICQLIVPDEAPRVGGLTGRKCRAQSALVVSGEGVSSYDRKTEYRVGDMVIAKNWDPSPLVECSGGIHFFLTREEAEDYLA